jgi:Fur family ferric uptake transcriptional regulator
MMERNTRQRGAIRRALQRADRPLSPAEVLADARREVNGLGIATVYRNIRALLDEHWLATVDLPGEPSRYELAGKAHHHHFRCVQCSRVYDVPCREEDPVADLPAGFLVTGHDVLLHGRCADCNG